MVEQNVCARWTIFTIVFTITLCLNECFGVERLNSSPMERQITSAAKAHNLTNVGVWSPDSEWIAYDTRFGEKGTMFDGSTIEAVNVYSGEVRKIYESINGAHCGVVTWHPRHWKVVFILGPENPTFEWQYGFSHRQGVRGDMP